MFIAVDSDLRPLWHHAVKDANEAERITGERPHALMPTNSYMLAWLTRWGQTRWFVVPR